MIVKIGVKIKNRNMNIWKTLMRIALFCATIQWVLLVIQLSLLGTINNIVFPLAILWSLWGIFTVYKYKKHDD